MQLWLQRHAAPQVAPGICYGRLNVPADATATQQAALAMAAALPPHAQVWSSPLQRCEQLAEALRILRPDLAPKIDPRLAEMDFGSWEGQTWSAIGQAPVDDWTRDFAHYAPGGGESVTQVMQRVERALADCAAQCGSSLAPVLWITHAGVVRAATLIAAGTHQVDRADQWPKDSVAWGKWRVLAL